MSRLEGNGFTAPIDTIIAVGGRRVRALSERIEEHTVSVDETVDEDAFFSTASGATTVANRYDLEKSLTKAEKQEYRELDRYWVNEPFAFVVIFHSKRENERKYYLVEPHVTETERQLEAFLRTKLRAVINRAETVPEGTTGREERKAVIETETRRLLSRYDIVETSDASSIDGLVRTIKSLVCGRGDADGIGKGDAPDTRVHGGKTARPEPAVLEEDRKKLTAYQVEKLLYRLRRAFVGYERIDGIKRDGSVEDISVDGYGKPVFVYHSQYEQLITNVAHGTDELDDFVVKLAQRSGEGISKRLPQVDATLPDGSRAQLTLGTEVSDHGTNYTIRQFRDVPFTPIDLVNWNTFSLAEIAFLWLAIENERSMLIAGGTASGKTTTLNALSLFVPSSSKLVSIEDTREIELPHRNWIASTTRPAVSADTRSEVTEYDLLETTLRQRPDYIIMGEVRGEEGRTLFQVLSTGHTAFTTFHADSVGEVLRRFTSEPIDVSKTLFTALDLVVVQRQTRLQGRTVRRAAGVTEINQYEPEHDEINVQDIYRWNPDVDSTETVGRSTVLEEIRFDRGWGRATVEQELFERRVVLAYLIGNGIDSYANVAATVQAFMNDSETVLSMIADGSLEDRFEELRSIESIRVGAENESGATVDRPDPGAELEALAEDVLDRAERSLFGPGESVFPKTGSKPESVGERFEVGESPASITGRDGNG